MARRSNGHDLARHVMKVLVEAARREFGMQLAKSKPERSVEGMGTHWSLQGQAANILHSVPAESTLEDIAEML